MSRKANHKPMPEPPGCETKGCLNDAKVKGLCAACHRAHLKVCFECGAKACPESIASMAGRTVASMVDRDYYACTTHSDHTDLALPFVSPIWLIAGLCGICGAEQCDQSLCKMPFCKEHCKKHTLTATSLTLSAAAVRRSAAASATSASAAAPAK